MASVSRVRINASNPAHMKRCLPLESVIGGVRKSCASPLGRIAAGAACAHRKHMQGSSETERRKRIFTIVLVSIDGQRVVGSKADEIELE